MDDLAHDVSLLEPQALRRREPVVWLNPRLPAGDPDLAGLPLALADILDAEARMARFVPLLVAAFPELAASGGRIDSPLVDVAAFASRYASLHGVSPACVLVKCDHALPVAGSVKARGGIYAVLHFAESVALEAGLLDRVEDDHGRLLEARAREAFGRYELCVGSTGNLGLSIGIMGAALGFRVSVHMSVEAKEWKKERLRRLGIRVVEHASDYTQACAVVRAMAAGNPAMHFVDDENSVELFLGYSVGGYRLREQLAGAGRRVDEEHPLFLYLPCGVGGAPGGITFGAKHAFGRHVHSFFAEPVEAPCMTIGMMTGRHSDASVRDLGLTLKTDADGLAVSTPSRFVGRMMEGLVSGCYTVTDPALYRFAADLYETEGIEVELSAAAGCAGPAMLLGTVAGRVYLEQHRLMPHLERATHVIWTTGGLFVPAEEHQRLRQVAGDLTQ
jgi:D-serine dehydratase